jgi:acyl-CoA hydrolase
VHYVVTEHGIAYLHGKSLRERAEALIAIADPRFQQELEDFAVRSHYLENKSVGAMA